MAEISNSGLSFSCVEEKENTQKILILDHADGVQCKTEADSFFISMPTPSNSSIKEDAVNSRTTRNFGRSGFFRSSFHNISSKIGGDSVPPNEDPLCINVPEKSSAMAVGQKHPPQTNQQVHHQIAITTGNTSNAITGSGTIEKRRSFRKNSFKRTLLKLILKPRNVAIFFASVSSVGSILLIYFSIIVHANVFHNEDVNYY